MCKNPIPISFYQGLKIWITKKVPASKTLQLVKIKSDLCTYVSLFPEIFGILHQKKVMNGVVVHTIGKPYLWVNIYIYGYAKFYEREWMFEK